MSETPAAFTIRSLQADDDAALRVVAERMRATLVEVLGEERGGSMYTMEWLLDRARAHLDPTRLHGAVLVAEDDRGELVGHTILRVEADEDGGRLGLISTTYVHPARRRAGLAEALLRAGESWLLTSGAERLATYTSDTNFPLIRLYEKHGYQVTLRAPESRMLRLSREARPS